MRPRLILPVLGFVVPILGYAAAEPGADDGQPSYTWHCYQGWGGLFPLDGDEHVEVKTLICANNAQYLRVTVTERRFKRYWKGSVWVTEELGTQLDERLYTTVVERGKPPIQWMKAGRPQPEEAY